MLGEPLYEGLHDRFFGVPGDWNFSRCVRCGLVWLNPMPVPADIGKAYEHYFTHHEAGSTTPSRTRPPLRERYLTAADTLAGQVVDFCTEISPAIYRDHIQRRQMYFEDIRPGRLLEVGCGDGRYLSILRGLGWNAEGQEVDPEAVKSARRREGVVVHEGQLEELGLDANSYDAILMSHVIEHVHEGGRLLEECHRLLKESGRIVVITPNVAGYGHQRFGRNWRALDPPRHLFLYSLETLTNLMRRVGFSDIEAWTSVEISHFVALESFQARNATRGGCVEVPGCRDRALARISEVAMNVAWLTDRSRGEECVVRARRSHSDMWGRSP